MFVFDHSITADLISKIGGLSSSTVLVLGDIMLDRYVSGQVDRISPEAPIPVLRYEHSRTVLGGAANVAHNIATLGARASLVGVIGDDEIGSELNNGAYGLPSGVELHAIIDRGRPTTLKTRYIAGAHQILRLDQEANAPLASPIADQILAKYKAALAKAAVVVLSDYAKGVLCDAVLFEAIALARRAGRPVIADPKRRSFAAYKNVSVLAPNRIEIEQATGISADDDSGVEQAGRAVLEQTQASAVLVTRSARGVSLVRDNGPTLHLPAEVREVADVSGAGDTFVATFAAMMAAGAALPEAAAVANIGAGIAVSKPGTATISHSELIAALHQREIRAIDDKIVPLADALRKASAWRQNGTTIGFTNGCFDLIHPGHVRLLEKARARCGRLIVGLNSDLSIGHLKGPSRPLQNEAARATVLGSMSAVDLVVVFNEDTPQRLIEALRPDVLFKGADYRREEVVGREIVEQGGGEVILIDLEPGFSTTEIIGRIGAV